MSHLYLSAAHKSSGKTLVSIGLCSALSDLGEQVQPFKKGPDYIDPMWLSQAAGRSCHNLDFYTMQPDEISNLFATAMQNASIGLIEGNKGLFDGLDVTGSNSNAALATQLGSPVILVLDTQGMTRGVAPLILGYQAFDKQVRIAGIILNKVGGVRHATKLRQAIEYYTDVPVLGAIHKVADMAIHERHLGLVTNHELHNSACHIQRIAAQVRQQVDLHRLIEIAHTARQPNAPVVQTIESMHADVTLAYAQDAAFGFYYASDLMALQQAGAKLVPFSPLQDNVLPKADGLLLGGGFPEAHLAQLAGNQAMTTQIQAFIERGAPTYAECGGLMYLCRSVRWPQKAGKVFQGKMLGVIPADVVMYDRPQGRGYVQLHETDQHPWPCGGAVAAHEFHYSALHHVKEGLRYAYRVARGQGIDGQYDGICYKNLLAGYTHLRHTQTHPWAQCFVEFVRVKSNKR